MARKYKIKHFYDIVDRSDFRANPDYKGVCHIAMAQEGHCLPGTAESIAGWLRCAQQICWSHLCQAPNILPFHTWGAEREPSVGARSEAPEPLYQARTGILVTSMAISSADVRGQQQ